MLAGVSLSQQLHLSLPMPAEAPVPAPDEEHGEVFTRRWVVELILDLVGYTPDRDLTSLVAVEPSCGTGAFLGPMTERLLASCAVHDRPVADAVRAIRAYDLLASNVEAARKTVVAALVDLELSDDQATALAQAWVSQGDFLLHEHDIGSADFVVGNPPYIRLESVPAARSAAYRRECSTMRGRSDIFIGFIETGLRLLRDEGALGFIVADRWMHNQYGAGLRAFISENFAVETVVEMHDVDAFEEVVSAYPAITVIRRAPQRQAVLANTTGAFGEREASRLASWAKRGKGEPLALPSVTATRLPGWFDGAESWPSGSPEELALVADLEKRCPPLEDPRTGTRVGIGLASGADNVYLTSDPNLVEQARLLPMVMAKDLAGGQLKWSGTHLVNPWDENGLVDLTSWPLLAAYFEKHAGQIKKRHTARKNPGRWFKTIDRVDPTLTGRTKLLLPDMKASIHPVLDDGNFYPHHNLYFVVSEGWDLDVLGGLMLSDIANLFVGTYCVKMRGGCYRFQAQYLRRIRVPNIKSVKTADRRALAAAFDCRDVEKATAVSARLYGIDQLPQSLDRASA